MLNFANFIRVAITLLYSVLSITAIAYGGKEHNLFWLMQHFRLKDFMSYINYGYAGVFFLATLMMTPIGDRIFCLFFCIRRASGREKQKIRRAVELVGIQYKKRYGKKLKVNVYVEDQPYPYAMAVGTKTVAVSTGLLGSASDEEITAVIAHEVGHLHYRDGVMCSLLFTGHMFISRGGVAFILFLARFVGPLIAGWMLLVGVMHYPVYGILYFGLIPLFYILRFIKFCISWPIEYRADRFAASLGFGQGIISFFDKLVGEDIRRKQGFLSYYAYSHPPSELRVDRMEKYLVNQQHA